MTNRLITLAVAILCFSFAACSKDDGPGNGGGDQYEVKAPTFQFTITNWDDGWVSTIKDNWVEVTKGNIKVLLHYPQDRTNVSADPEPYVNTAWDILVAPRYSHLKDYRVGSPSLDYERAYLGSGSVTDNASGRMVFVGLFKKGNSGWIEVIAPDVKTFTAQFGVDPATITWSTNSSVFNALRVMANYNRFAVAAGDIASTGKWSNNFGSNTYYYSMYTGLGMGMSSYTATEEFVFKGNGSYNWQIITANSAGGGTNIASAKSAGTYKLPDNWNLSFSDIEGTPRKYAAWFSAKKEGRILFIDGNPYSWVGK